MSSMSSKVMCQIISPPMAVRETQAAEAIHNLSYCSNQMTICWQWFHLAPPGIDNYFRISLNDDRRHT